MAFKMPCVLMICADEAGKQVVVKLKALLSEDGLLKRLTSNQSPIVIRSSTYKLLALICKRCAAHFFSEIFFNLTMQIWCLSSKHIYFGLHWHLSTRSHSK